MDKIDAVLTSLEPEIERKCMEIKRKKSEKLLTELFITIAAALLIIPTVLALLGVSIAAVLVPTVAAAAVFIVSTPILISKGA